jgi:hypothetical protein
MHLSTEWDSVGNLIWTTVTSHDLRGLFHSKSRKRMQAQSRPLDLERALFSLSGIAHPCVTAVILQGAKERVKANLQTRRWYSIRLLTNKWPVEQLFGQLFIVRTKTRTEQSVFGRKETELEPEQLFSLSEQTTNNCSAFCSFCSLIVHIVQHCS